MKKRKVAISIDETIKTLEMRDGLWDSLDVAVRLDPHQRFSNRSEAIRFLIAKFVEEVKEDIRNEEH